MTSSIWAHEGKHLSAAMAAANSSEGDLHRLLGPLTSRSASQLWAAAKLEFENAHDYIKGQANNHNGTFSTFWFYMPSPAPSWLYSSIPLENN